MLDFWSRIFSFFSSVFLARNSLFAISSFLVSHRGISKRSTIVVSMDFLLSISQKSTLCRDSLYVVGSYLSWPYLPTFTLAERERPFLPFCSSYQNSRKRNQSYFCVTQIRLEPYVCRRGHLKVSYYIACRLPPTLGHTFHKTSS